MIIKSYIRVHLSQDEAMEAATEGITRHIESLYNDRVCNDLYDPVGNHWAIDIESSASELAVSRWSGRPWTGKRRSGRGDVDGWEVRHTPRPTGRLIIRPDDPDDEPFILARGKIPSIILIGWTWGKRGKNPSFLLGPNDRDPAYFVPEVFLWDLRILEEEYAKRM